MTATYCKQIGNFRITLTRREAETLGCAYTSYGILLTALRSCPDSDSFTIYGSRDSVRTDLARARA